MLTRDLDELYGAPTEVSQYTKRSSNQVQIQKTFPRSAQAKSQGKAELQDKRFPSQKVFYDWQMYDAFEQMKKFVRMAKKELVIIDP